MIFPARYSTQSWPRTNKSTRTRNISTILSISSKRITKYLESFSTTSKVITRVSTQKYHAVSVSRLHKYSSTIATAKNPMDNQNKGTCKNFQGRVLMNFKIYFHRYLNIYSVIFVLNIFDRAYLSMNS